MDWAVCLPHMLGLPCLLWLDTASDQSWEAKLRRTEYIHPEVYNHCIVVDLKQAKKKHKKKLHAFVCLLFRLPSRRRSLKAVEWTGEGRRDRWQWWGAIKQEGGGRRRAGQEVSFHCLPRRMDMGTGMCVCWVGSEGKGEGCGISFVPRPTMKKDINHLNLVTQFWVCWHKSES